MKNDFRAALQNIVDGYGPQHGSKWCLEQALAALKTEDARTAALLARLDEIAAIAEGSQTINSLPHIAKIARGATKVSV